MVASLRERHAAVARILRAEPSLDVFTEVGEDGIATFSKVKSRGAKRGGRGAARRMKKGKSTRGKAKGQGKGKGKTKTKGRAARKRQRASRAGAANDGDDDDGDEDWVP